MLSRAVFAVSAIGATVVLRARSASSSSLAAAPSAFAKRSLLDVSLKGKRVLIRVDFNVPFDKKTGAISNTQQVLPRVL